MTGNQVIDWVLIVIAGVFFLAGGAFLPLWEYTQGRGGRRHHGERYHGGHHGAGVSA